MLESIPIGVLIGVLAGLFPISAFFSASETALMSVNRYQLAHSANKGNKNAQRVLRLLSRPDRLIGLILLGNNFTNILIAQLATYIGYRLYGSIGVAIVTGVLTFLMLIFAELAPKTLAAAHARKVSLFAAAIYVPLLTLVHPFVWFINLIANALLNTLGISQSTETINPLDREELRTVLTNSRQRIPKEYQLMLLGILDLDQRSVEDIMIPRNEIQGIDLNDDWDSIENQLFKAVYTRVPLYENDINHIIGILHIREIPDMLKEERLNKETLVKVSREPYCMPEHTTLRDALINFKKHKRRIGLIVDEYGDIQGLITLEDLLEQIVGEFTNDPGTYDQEIKPQSDGSVIVDGGCHVRELNAVMNWNLSEKGAKTVSGLVVERLETIPQAGTGLLIENHPVEVIKTQHNTVSTVKIRPPLNKHQSG